MRTMTMVVPISAMAVVEVDIPEVGDCDSDGRPLQMAARFSRDENGTVDLHAPVVPMEREVVFASPEEQGKVLAFTVAAVLHQAQKEHAEKHRGIVEQAKTDAVVQALSWGQKGSA